MWLNVQSDSKKKCLILKNLCAMSFWDLERIVENDSIIWELWGGDYIYRGVDKTKFSRKNNMVNRFTKWVNRFRQQKYKPRIHEGWHDSVHKWINSSEPRMKNDAIQPSVESIQCESESFMIRFKLWRIDSHVIRLEELWFDSSAET